MSPSLRSTSKEGNGSLLPSHAGSTPYVETQDSDKKSEEPYNVANTNLLELEEELDVLLHCARLLRDQRAKITHGRLKSLGDGTTKLKRATELEGARELEEAAELEEANHLTDEYLKLAKKGRSVEDMIKTLKGECAAGRSECDYYLRSPGNKRRQTLRERKGLASGHPESGFIDRDALADRIINAESTATNFAGVVGAFGAGITYTTLFSASRGRLDLISWAFTCFFIVVIDSTALQMFALPRHGQLARIFRTDYHGSVEKRIFIFTVLVGIPLVVGLILLGVSVATLNQGFSPITGSDIAIKVSGYLPIAVLSYFAVIIIAVMGAMAISLLPERFRPGPTALYVGDTRHPTYAIYPLQEKLQYLPGGPGYIHYRRKHLGTAKKS